MKKAFAYLSIIFLFAFISSAQAQRKRKSRTVKPPTEVQKVDLNKLNQPVTRPQMSDLQKFIIKHFTGVKFGKASQQYGANELVLVDRLFPVMNKTKISGQSRKKEPRVITVKEDLAISVNTRDFNDYSEGNEAWLKAGNVFNVLSFLGGTPTSVTIPRNPIKLTINLPAVANRTYQVQNPEQISKLFQAEEYLIAQNARPASPGLSFSFHKIHSVEELEFKLTGKYRGLLSSFSAEVGLKPGNQQFNHFYVLEFRQNMFSIQTEDMDPANIFTKPVTDMAGYIYIDKVDYGRKGLVIFKCTQTLEDLGIKAAKDYEFGLSEKNMKTTYEELKKKKEVTMFAHFYGATSVGDIQSMENNVKTGSKDIFTLIKTIPTDYRLALPIGYTIKNMNNQFIGLKSYKTQTITTKSSAPLLSNYKLKVTLTDIQSIKVFDRDDIDDLGIQQYIVYKALGKEKKYADRNINKFPERIDMPGQVPNINNPLIKGDMNNQIQVRQTDRITMRNRNMIDNSLIFYITSDELNDPKASFEIFTWLKEYSTHITYGNSDWVYMHNKSVKVKIKDVVEILQGRKILHENTTIPGLGIVPEVRFHNFGFDFMKLANIRKKTPLVLEGPIYHIETQKIKVAVWVQFELIK